METFTTLRVRSSEGSAEIREQREDHTEADKLFKVTVCTCDTIYYALYHYLISDYMHQLCFLYAKLSSHLLAVRERERQ